MRRVMVKLSGEALAGGRASGICPDRLEALSGDIARVRQQGCEIAVVIGGGNLFRGASLSASGMDRTVADHMGMLATVMNGLALREALARQNTDARVLSAIPLDVVCESYSRDRAVHHLVQGRVVICVGGLGVPYFTTDSAAAARAAEMRCDALLKATNVDGIYNLDPNSHPEAERFTTLTHQQAIAQNLRVMDTAAFALARDNRLPIVVFSIQRQNAISRVLTGELKHSKVYPTADDETPPRISGALPSTSPREIPSNRPRRQVQ